MKSKFYSFLLCLFFFASSQTANATTDTIFSGSFIINMGIVPQTIGNGLKPYGLIYDLMKNHKVPVKWIINSSKGKDGIDFTHNGVNYRGGTFIIPFEYRTPTVNAVIASWQLQGVIGATSVSIFLIDVYKTIHYAPNWTMDKYNGQIAVEYFANAGIPSSAYGGDSSNWKTPDQLGACDDIFVMPHADPTWATHSNLYYWNLNHKGNIWAGCHAVSEIENLTSPDSSVVMNFLSTQGLLPTETHKKHSTPPFLYDHPTDFVMQFMGGLDNATINGSERIFYPVKGGNWRSSTMVGVYDIVDSLIPSLSDGPAAAIAYGRAFGDENRGWVMYEGGHSLTSSGTTAEQVAAQRAFFNYSLSVSVDRLNHFAPTITGLSEVLLANTSYTLSFTVPDGIDLSNYTIRWSSSCSGSFSPDSTSQSVVFNPGMSAGACIVSVSLTDGCGRQFFQSQGVYTGSVLPVSTTGLRAFYNKNQLSVELQWSNYNNKVVSHFEVQRSEDGKTFETVAIVFSNGKNEASYKWIDANITRSSLYYRIKAVGSTVSYSPIAKISTGDAQTDKLTILSNPVRNQIAFEYRSGVSQAVQVQLIGLNGNIVSSRFLNLKAGINTIQLMSTQQLSAGTYVLQIKGNNANSIAKVTVIR